METHGSIANDLYSNILESSSVDLDRRSTTIQANDDFHGMRVRDEFFADRQLVTIFSAPNYCGDFDNAGAMMSVDESLMCSFQILRPAEKKPKFAFGSTTTAKLGTPLMKTKSFLGARIG